MERRIYGIETEYAMALEAADRSLQAVDPGKLFDSIEAAIVERFATLEVDSFGRDPGRAQNSDIATREGRFLENGARVYYDTGHIEWSTPECLSARQAVLYELAGERTLAELAGGVARARGGRILLLKNNVDYARERTFGCHENYLFPRGATRRADEALFERLIRHLVPFLVTRQIFTGAGRLGSTDPGTPYQLSQRADFIQTVVSTETRSERGIINSRDESLGEQRYRRLHLIVGDSNRSAFANVLKLGTTGLVLQLIEEDVLRDVPELKDPVAAIRAVSRDLTCRIALPLKNGKRATALEVQQYYLESVEKYRRSRSANSDVAELLAQWRRILQDLNADPICAADRVDWLIKLHHLLGPRLKRAGVSWEEVGAWSRVFAELRRSRGITDERLAPPSADECARLQYLLGPHGLHWRDFEMHHRLFFELRECDLRYHDIDPERGLFSLLKRTGVVKRVFEDAELETAQREPPASRARLRAEVIRWARLHGRSHDTLLDWGRVAFPGPRGAVALPDPFATEDRELAVRLSADKEIAIRILDEETVPPTSWTSRLRRLFGGET